MKCSICFCAVVLVCLLLQQSVVAQGWTTIGPRSMALGGASVTMQDAWSVSNNPATMAKQKKSSIALAYESRYFNSGLGTSSLNMFSPLGRGSVGVSALHYGIQGYARNQVGLAYGIQLLDGLSVGTQLHYHHFRIGGGYGSLSRLTADLGVLIQPLPSLQLAAFVSNPWRTRLAEFDDERMSTALRVGASYEFSEKVRAFLEAEKDVVLPVDLKFGVEYQPVAALNIRLGSSSSRRTFCFGLGYIKGRWSGEIGAEWSQRVGYSSCLGLSYSFQKKTE